MEWGIQWCDMFARTGPLKVADALLIVSKGVPAQVVEGAVRPKVRVIFEMPWVTRDWPGDFMLAKLVKNESQNKTFLTTSCNSEKYSYHDRAYVNDYQPGDELNVYIYKKDNGGIEDGHVEQIAIPGNLFQEALTAELMAADGNKHDVMVVCSVKIRFSGCEWMRDISASAELIDKGAELYVPGNPLLED